MRERLVLYGDITKEKVVFDYLIPPKFLAIDKLWVNSSSLLVTNKNFTFFLNGFGSCDIKRAKLKVQGNGSFSKQCDSWKGKVCIGPVEAKGTVKPLSFISYSYAHFFEDSFACSGGGSSTADLSVLKPGEVKRNEDLVKVMLFLNKLYKANVDGSKEKFLRSGILLIKQLCYPLWMMKA